MNIRAIREELRMGRSIYDLPLRVTFYARVSTDKLEQQGSLENQIQYYTSFIQKNPHWSYVPGYVDEGISGSSTYKREDFMRMIADARQARFDFIITKEISRFSRNTLDSIRYTQQLLEDGVAVLFQNDNINTLDSDSEFRLVVMAGVAQDEVRKLSERLQFGFRQSIKNGRVLGNDQLWGYHKKDCKLTILPDQAEVVRLIFELYATGEYGLRSLSRELTARGYTSTLGTPFNTTTIGHILTNPKYKGWYCGNKTKSLDYRSKKTLFLPEEEWVSYPDPTIPAIVSEALWEQANTLYKKRSQRVKASGVGYQSRYPYSGKILCGIHHSAFHRQAFQTKQGLTEFWTCKVHREKGKASCQTPKLYTRELDAILTDLFGQMISDQETILSLVLSSLTQTEQAVDHHTRLERFEGQIRQLERKKERLLDLRIEEALTTTEWAQHNQRCNEQLDELRRQLADLQGDMAEQHTQLFPLSNLQTTLLEELDVTKPMASELLVPLLDHVLVCEESRENCIQLEVHLYTGQIQFVEFRRKPFVFLINTSKSITPKLAIKMI